MLDMLDMGLAMPALQVPGWANKRQLSLMLLRWRGQAVACNDNDVRP